MDVVIIEQFLVEFDEIFEGQALVSYVQYVIQNWLVEFYIQGVYFYDFEDRQWWVVEVIQELVVDCLFFVGEVLFIDYQVMVYGVCVFVFDVVVCMLKES